MGSLGAEHQSSSEDPVRVHITPFNPDLLDKIIPPSLQPLASGISFHTVQTFPERGFGFVELPKMEAQKLKKKLNGSILKGTKVRIEDARPEKKRKSDDEGEGEDEGRKARKTERKEKKRREEGAILGHEIEEGRRVKRGWKDDGAAKQGSRTRRKSQEKAEQVDQGLEGRKLRFKTSLPPTTSPTEPDREVKTKKKDKSEGSKSGKKKVVVEEFGKKTKLPATPVHAETSARGPLSFEEGKGWVDEAGNIIEADRKSKRQKPQTSDQDGEGEGERRISAIESREIVEDAITMEPSDLNEAVEDDSMSVDNPELAHNETNVESSEKEVHPLEALFKRPATRSTDTSSKPRPTPIDTSFSFFNSGGARDQDEDMGDDSMPPQTPRTRRDLEWRGIRSAAPTPDTAAIGRHFSFPGIGGSEDEDEEVEGRVDAEMDGVEHAPVIAAGKVEDGGGEESAFRKWFYENRGEYNRGWKKSRREGRKLERQRENRKVGRRVV